MIQAKSTHDTITTLSQALRSSERIFFSRFGDGDVFIMDGKNQANHVYSDALKDEMIDSFKIEHPQFLKALSVNYPKEENMCRGCFAPFQTNEYLADVVQSVLASVSTNVFENPVVFHYLSIFHPDRMNAFLDEFIRGKRILFIGATQPKIIEKVLGTGVLHVETPIKNAYHSIDEWWPQVVENIDKVDIVIPSAGMASRVINKRLWNVEANVHSIDIGSIFDAVSGKKTRTWIQLVGHRVEDIVLPQYRNTSFLFKVKRYLLDVRFAVKRFFR